MSTTVNLDIKYGKKVQQAFAIGSLVQGRLEDDLDFVGAKTVRVHTVATQPLNDYQRSGTNRYGDPKEVGDSVQEFTMKKDRSFASTVDKGNSKEESINRAGVYLASEMREQVIPEKDRHTLQVLADNAGEIKTESGAVSKENVTARMLAARKWMLDHRVPTKGRTWFVTSDVYNALLDSKAFTEVEKLAQKAVVNGQVGAIYGSPVVEVPADLMPAGVNFILVHKSAAAAPAKINETKLHRDPPGISGNLMEGRFLYDAFVIGAKANGIYVNADETKARLAAPTITAKTGAIAITGSGTCKYTLDGSDPRYSESAKIGTQTVGMKTGDIIKACEVKENKYTSPVAVTKYTGA